MEKNPPRVSRKNEAGAHKSSRWGGEPRRRGRTTAVDDGGGGDRIECSGKYCRSCTAALIADCVALCCCPCALLNFLALAFVRVPWMVGRRCLGIGTKKSKKKLEMQRKCKRCGNDSVILERGIGSNNDRRGRVNQGIMVSEMSSLEDTVECVSARFEAEKVWLELYQVGHLGFGRVSFTGCSITSG